MAKKQSMGIDFFFTHIKDLIVQIGRHNLGDIPKAILNTMDILYKDKEYRPLLKHNGVEERKNGWHFIFTLNEGCSFDDVHSKLDYFQSVIEEGTVEMYNIGKFLHIDVNTFKFNKSYAFDPVEIKNELLKDKYKHMYMPVVVGVKRGGGWLVVDLADIPHILVAGINKSGKSSWMKQACFTVKMTRPNAVICCCDFGGADASQLEHIAFVATELSEAKLMMAGLVAEVKKRLAFLKKHKMSKIHSIKEVRPILLAVDEMTEMKDPDVQADFYYLARMGRKAGLDIIAGTQKPSHKTFKDFCESRSQFEARMCFRMSEAKDSHIVLGNNKAFEYIRPNNSGRGIWSWTEDEVVQGLYISDDDIEAMLNNPDYVQPKEERGVDMLVEPRQNLWLLPR